VIFKVRTTKITIWEAMILLFKKGKWIQDGDISIYYKRINNKYFILKEQKNE